MRLPRRHLWSLVLCLLAACTSPSPEVGTRDPPADRDAGGRYLAAVLAGEVQHPAVASQGELIVVIGGVGGDPAWARFGVVVGDGGPTRTIDLPTSLADPTAASMGDRFLVAGRACTDPPVRTDTGVACEGGRATAFIVDAEAGRVTDVALPEIPADPTGSTLTLETFSLGEQGVIAYRDRADLDVILVDDDGAVALDPPGVDGGICSGGEALYAYRLDPSGTPDIADGVIDPGAFGAMTVALTASVLPEGGGGWEAVPPVPGQPIPGGGSVHCTADRLVLVAPDQVGGGAMWSFSPASGRWTAADAPSGLMGAAVFAGQGSARLLVGPVAGEPFVVQVDGSIDPMAPSIEGWGEPGLSPIIAPTPDGGFVQLVSSRVARRVA